MLIDCRSGGIRLNFEDTCTIYQMWSNGFLLTFNPLPIPKYLQIRGTFFFFRTQYEIGSRSSCITWVLQLKSDWVTSKIRWFSNSESWCCMPIICIVPEKIHLSFTVFDVFFFLKCSIWCRSTSFYLIFLARWNLCVNHLVVLSRSLNTPSVLLLVLGASFVFRSKKDHIVGDVL